MQRIDKRPKQTDEDAQCLFEKQDSRVRGGHDEALKVLYDQSVNFKNDLADLRQRVKGISSTYNKYNAKVEVLFALHFVQGIWSGAKGIRQK